ARQAPGADRSRSGNLRQPPLLPGGAAEPARRDRAPDRGGGTLGLGWRQRPALSRLVARDRGETVRLRPRQRSQAQSAAAGGLRRGPDLPDRSLPWQGDGPEPVGLPLWERALRADLESALHRLRPDHGGRDGGGRGPWRVVRRDWR